MSMPTKDKAEVLANPDAFREAYARACEFFRKFDGVVDVAFGQKRTAGEYQDNIAFVIYVREKKNEEDIPPEQRIPPSFEGYPTDVRVVRPGVAQGCDNTDRYDKVKGGIQIMVENKASAGTLGCLVQKRGNSGRDNIYLLTNKHVLFSADAGVGDDVYHPTIGDENLGPVQAGLYGNFPHPIGDPAAQLYFIDAAIARINRDSTCWGSTCTKDATETDETFIVDLQVNNVNSISDVRDVRTDPGIVNSRVFKVGRTTGKTTGRVRLVNVPVNADPEPDKPAGPRVNGLRTIYIEFEIGPPPNDKNCKNHQRFTEDGDSGSIIVDEQNRVIGLHSHGGLPIAPFTLAPSFACFIVPVLDHLGICIPVTTGTSHGSSKATDGSGIAPAPLSASGSALVDGQIAFASQTAAGVSTSSPGFPPPTALTDAEVTHMRLLLDSLRETEKGREIHHHFGQVRREIGYLIRNCRPVKVAWHRHQGPAFLAHFLNHLKGHTPQIPHEVKGISRETLLARMIEVLSIYGSSSVRRAIKQYGEEFMGLATSMNSVHDCIEYLQEKETV